MSDFMARYNAAHRNRINRALHSVGIPAIVVSFPVLFWSWRWALGLFVGGWILQFLGHVFEGKPPAFFADPRFLFVGVGWWAKKLFGRTPPPDAERKP